jgi:hypothetical protein
MVRRLAIIAFCLVTLSLNAAATLRFIGNVARPGGIGQDGNLKEILDKAAPNTEAVLMIAADGSALRIHRSLFPHARLACENGAWNSYDDGEIPGCEIRNLTALALDRGNHTFDLHLLNGLDEIDTITPYAAIERGFDEIGPVEKNGLRVVKYQRKQAPWSITAEKVTALCEGRPEYYSDKITLTVTDFYFTAKGDTVTGLWRDPPAESIYSLHDKLLPLMKEGPVLALFVDSYGMFLRDQQNILGDTTALQKLPLQPLRAAYPSKTESSYWAFGTGNSFWRRGESRTILEDVLPAGTDAVLVEEERPYYQALVPVLKNSDENKDGAVDDDIYRAALAELPKNHRFMLVHFHSIDDDGHRYGPYSEQRLQRTRQVSDYVTDLISRWKGPVILFSDHGMHDNARHGGGHGTAAIEDMLALWGRVK